MKHLYIFTLLLATLVSHPLAAQKNITKTNALPEPLMKIYGISQERMIGKSLSFWGGIKIMPQTSLPGAGFTTKWYTDQSRNPFKEAKMKGGTLNAGFRKYGNDKASANGFYWGAYFSVARFTTQTGKISSEFVDRKTQVIYAVEVIQNYKLMAAGGGLEIGVQKKIGKKLVFDWTILGVGIADIQLDGNIQISDESDNFDLRNFCPESRDASLALEKYFSLEKSIEAKRVVVSGKGWAPAFKMGLAIGFGY
jgi:hypothetical protein